jgi:hypothetical protein
MREYLRLETPSNRRDTNPAVAFPIFLEKYIPMIDSFVKRMHIKASP